MSTRTTCPLHPDYQGPKPRGARYWSAEGRRWRQEKAETERIEQEHRERVRARQLASRVFTCPREGCDQSFATRDAMNAHRRQCLVDGQLQIQRCTVPGCTFFNADATKVRKHYNKCIRTFEYESPTCQACGYQINNKVWSAHNAQFEKSGGGASNQWNQHLRRYAQTRQVDCQLCREPHIVPWCLKTPKAMGRHFRCSDNFLILGMGSAECRRNHPREGGEIPAWMEVNDAEEEGNNEDDEDDDPGPTHRPARRRRRRTRQIGNGIDAVMVYVDTGEVVSEDEDENDEDRNEVDQSDEPGTHIPRRGRRGAGAGAAQSQVPPHTGTPPRRQRRPEMTEVGSGTELERRHDDEYDDDPGQTHRPARRRRRRTRQFGNGMDAVTVYADTGEVVSEDGNDEDNSEIDHSDEPGTHIPRRGRRGTGAGAAQSRVPPHTGTPPRR